MLFHTQRHARTHRKSNNARQPNKHISKTRNQKHNPTKKENILPMKLLIAGTRGSFKNYREQVHNSLNTIEDKKNLTIIEGCCPNSADQYAEEWATKNNIPILHHPSTPGNYLKRNIEMAQKCDTLILFWDNFSYGSCHVLAHCVRLNKKTFINTLVKK